MQTPRTPAAPWPPNPRRRGMPPPVLSPGSFSRSAFSATPAAASGGGDPAVSEYPCVSLLEWWLASVEGDDRKIAVGGIFERNQTIQQFAPAPIAKRHEACVLETENGIIVLIHGQMNITRMLDDGYSIKVCEEFVIGFPHWWQSCNILYPKALKSRVGSKLRSSCTNNSGMDSTRFYLEKFQLGKQLLSLGSSFIDDILNNAKTFSHNNTDAFQKSSHLPNGTPRFEECGCDGDIATNKKDAAPNGDTERYGAACTEVANMEVGLLAGNTFGAAGHSDIDNVSLEFIVECANDVGNEEADNAPAQGDQRTPVAPLKSQGCQEETQDISFNKAVADDEMPASVSLDVQHSSYLSDGVTRSEEYTCVGDIPIIPTNDKTASNDDCERCTAVSKEVDSVEIGLIVGTLREPDHGGNATDISLPPTLECTNDAGNEGSDDTPPTSTCKETLVPYLKSQGCWRKSQSVALSKKAVADEHVPTSVSSDVQNSSYLSHGTPGFEKSTCVGDVPMNEQNAASNDDIERYAGVSKQVDDMEIGLIADSTLTEPGHGDNATDVTATSNDNSERHADVSKEVDGVEIGLIADNALTEPGHGDNANNVSLGPRMECTNDAGSDGSDDTPPTGSKETPVPYLKSQGCSKKSQHMSLSKKAVAHEAMPTSVYLDVQDFSHLSAGSSRSDEYTCVGDISTNEMAAASNDDSERNAAVSMEVDNVEIDLIVGDKLRGGCSNTATNLSLVPTAECTDDSGRKKAPVISLKRRGRLRKPQHVAREKMASDQDMPTSVVSDAQSPGTLVDLPKEQRSAHRKNLQGATRLQVTRSPVPYAHQSPLTRGRATSLSLSTPEALKLRKTRSGRVVVPTLDSGLQWIVYDSDGSISGVAGSGSAPPPKGGKVKVSTRKKRKAP